MSDITTPENENTEVAPKKGHLTFEQIQGINDITEQVVEVSEWDGTVLVRSISKQQMDQILKAAEDKRTGERDGALMEKLIICTGLVDPALTSEQYDALKDKTASAWLKIYRAISDSSNMRDIAQSVAEERFQG